MSNHKHSKKNSKDNLDMNNIADMVNNMDKAEFQDVLSKLNIDKNALNNIKPDDIGKDKRLQLLTTLKPYLNKDKRKMLDKIEKIYSAARLIGGKL